jgi:hypothetical protein
MAKAVVDPAELRRFAQDLKKFALELQQQTGALSEEFDSTVRVLQKFTKAAEQHVPYLLRKADAAESYLNQR